MSILFSAVLALAMPTAPIAPLYSPQEKAQDPAAELEQLESEFSEAQDAFFAPLEKAKSEEERAKIRLDPSKNPVRTFAPRFQDLAKRAKGTETGARSLLWIVSNAQDPRIVVPAVEELAADYLSSPLLADLTRNLRYGSRVLGEEKSRELLEKIAGGSTHAEVRASALFALGALQHQAGSVEKATEIFRRIQKEFPGTEPAKDSAGYLFEIERLQIGMTAPDFDAVDENGVAYKLSDLRGKVVVLDFWGIW